MAWGRRNPTRAWQKAYLSTWGSTICSGLRWRLLGGRLRNTPGRAHASTEVPSHGAMHNCSCIGLLAACFAALRSCNLCPYLEASSRSLAKRLSKDLQTSGVTREHICRCADHGVFSPALLAVMACPARGFTGADNTQVPVRKCQTQVDDFSTKPSSSLALSPTPLRTGPGELRRPPHPQGGRQKQSPRQWHLGHENVVWAENI